MHRPVEPDENPTGIVRKRYSPPAFESVPISDLVRGQSGAGNDSSRGFDPGRPLPR